MDLSCVCRPFVSRDFASARGRHQTAERQEQRMSMIDEAFASLKANAAKAPKAKPQNVAKSRKGRKAAKGKSARQKANQTNRKATLDNCYREGGGYWASVQALRALGMNR